MTFIEVFRNKEMFTKLSRKLFERDNVNIDNVWVSRHAISRYCERLHTTRLTANMHIGMFTNKEYLINHYIGCSTNNKHVKTYWFVGDAGAGKKCYLAITSNSVVATVYPFYGSSKILEDIHCNFCSGLQDECSEESD